MAEGCDVVVCQGADGGAGGCGAVLAHGRYEDAVAEGGAADGEGREEGWCCAILFGVWGGRSWGGQMLWGEVWEARDALVVVLGCHVAMSILRIWVDYSCIKDDGKL